MAGRIIASNRPTSGVARKAGYRATSAAAEDSGLVFAFRARSAAAFLVAAAVSVLAMWPRNLVYVAFAVAFFLLGYIPFALRRHPWAERIKLTFVALDVLLITAAILNIPGTVVWKDWPIQTRLRSQNSCYCYYFSGRRR